MIAEQLPFLRSQLPLWLTIAVIIVLLALPSPIRNVGMFFYSFFLPGLIWSQIFWRKSDIDVAERITLSIGLSIFFISMTIFSLAKIGVPINSRNSFLEILAVIIIGFIILLLRAKRHSTVRTTRSP